MRNQKLSYHPFGTQDTLLQLLRPWPEMLPIVDKPTIQFHRWKALKSGDEDIFGG